MKNLSEIKEIRAYIYTLESSGYSKHTIRSYKTSLQKLLDGFPKIHSVSDISNLTKLEFIEFVNSMSVDQNSKRTFLRNVRAFASWLYSNLGVDIRGTFDVSFGKSKLPEVKKKSRPVLSTDEIVKVISAGRNKQERLMVAMFFHTFIRNSEMANIKMQDIDGCRIKLTRKGGDEGFTVLSRDICDMLEDYIQNERDTDGEYLFYGTRGNGRKTTGPINGSSINDRVKACVSRSGIDEKKISGFTTHSCRRTGITISNLMRGVRVTQILANHATIEQTMAYDQSKMSDVASALNHTLWETGNEN